MLRTLLGLSLVSGLAFSKADPKPLSFEVADIQATQNKDLPPSGQLLPGGRVDIKNVPFKMLVVEAYKLTDDRVTGGPAWIKSETFDIVAKAVPTSTNDDLRKMLQNLLAERFKLLIHHEEKIMPVYALIVGKKGTKLQPAADPNGPKNQCKSVDGVQAQSHVLCQNMTIADMAQELPRMAPGYIDAPVVDMTGIKGSYDIPFNWMGRGSYNTAVSKSNNGADLDPLAVSMFDVVEKLGLKLDSRKQPIDIIVIDSVERVPTAN